jgi:hypothetical protein
MFDFQQRYSCKVIIKDEDYFLDVVTIKEKGQVLDIPSRLKRQ